MNKRYLFLVVLLLVSPALCLADGILTLSMGKVDIKSDSAVKWVPARINMNVLSSDTIRVGKKSKAVIKLTDGNLINVPAMKVVRLSDLESQKGATGQKSLGQLFKEKGIKLTKTSGDNNGITAVAGVRGADVDSKKDLIKPSQLKWKD